MEKKKNIIIVLNYNDYQETTRYCNVMKDYPIIDLIIVVDNRSTDDSYTHLKEIEGEKVKVLLAQSNNGYSAGNNVGLKYILDNNINCNIIVSNPDIYVSNESIEKILEQLKDPSIGLSTGLVTTQGKVTSNYAWNLPTYWDIVLNRFLLLYRIKRKLGSSIYLSYPKNEKYIYCECVSGCYFTLTSETLKQIGLMDERTFLFGEENILGFKIKNNNQRVCVVVDANVEHDQHHSIKKSRTSRQRIQKWEHDATLIYIKHYLNKNTFMCNLFTFLFWVSYYERYVMGTLSRKLSNK